LGDREAALAWLGKALRVWLEKLPGHPWTEGTLEFARRVHAELGRLESFDDWLAQVRATG
jgi:hypothetical protein